jgi:thioredoxin-like negative regulator of GroEL
MPMVQLFIHGKKVAEFVGASKEKLDKLLENYDKS